MKHFPFMAVKLYAHLPDFPSRSWAPWVLRFASQTLPADRVRTQNEADDKE
jgi:hypothetical protein